MQKGKIQLSAQISMGLVSLLLPEPHRLGDARLFLHGRLGLWPDWLKLSAHEKLLISRLLGSRPDSLTDDGSSLEVLFSILDDAVDFEIDENDSRSNKWETKFRLVPGKPVGVRINTWLDELESVRSPRSRLPRLPSDVDTVEFLTRRSGFRIPVGHMPPMSESDVCLQIRSPSAPKPPVCDESRLNQLAEAINSNSAISVDYKKIAVEQFFTRLRGDADSLTIPEPGPTQLVVAPTGSGKSVFTRLIAIDLARQGHSVAIVVPDIQSVWRETRRLEHAIVSAGLELSVAPLSSWRGLARHVADYLEKPPERDPQGIWALQKVGYECHLTAYSTSEALRPGEEPCTRLTQRYGELNQEESVICPFAGSCRRFDGFRTAATADIVVANHHAFLIGQVPLPVVLDDSSPQKLSTLEFVMARCEIILIDEIDSLQEVAIASSSRGLQLSSQGALSTPFRLLNRVEQQRAEGRLPAEVRLDRVRGALHRLTHVAEDLADAVNRGDINWPLQGSMTWQEANDAWLARQLYPDDSQGTSKLRRLFDLEPMEERRDEEMRCLLHPLGGPGLGDGTLADEIRSKLMSILGDWTPRHVRSAERAQRQRRRLVDTLMHRAALMQLDHALRHLRPQLAMLEQHGLKEASELRAELLGYVPWSPSPAGPLGDRLFGYSFSGQDGETGVLESRALTGDPHGLIAELGHSVALAKVGTPRIVLGFSATARFRGSPTADIVARLWGGLEDSSRAVRVRRTNLDIRVSGVSLRERRLQAIRTMVEELQRRVLLDYLSSLQRKPYSASRARALLVTGSYEEARVGAEALLAVNAPGLQVRFLVPSAEDSQKHEAAISRRQLEEFGHVPVPAVLVAPLKSVARGHNILQPGTSLSALSGIFVLTRPVPPSHRPEQFLAHISYDANMNPIRWRGSAQDSIMKERRRAWQRLRALQTSPSAFGRMDARLRQEIVCDVLVELEQLIGRARRGGTPVDLHFVDAAFDDDLAPWPELVRGVLKFWRSDGWLEEMLHLHGAFIHALQHYAGDERN